VLRSQSTDIKVSFYYKIILERTYDYGIACSYDGFQHFKRAVSADATIDPSIHGISSSELE
jgi:hypothetical protein